MNRLYFLDPSLPILRIVDKLLSDPIRRLIIPAPFRYNGFLPKGSVNIYGIYGADIFGLGQGDISVMRQGIMGKSKPAAVHGARG